MPTPSPRIVIQNRYKVSTVQIGLVAVNKQDWNNIFAEQPDDDSITVQLRNTENSSVAATWNLGSPETDSLFINVKEGYVWINWVKTNDLPEKGFFVPLQAVEWIQIGAD
jgi:hypothetical protein